MELARKLEVGPHFPEVTDMTSHQPAISMKEWKEKSHQLHQPPAGWQGEKNPILSAV